MCFVVLIVHFQHIVKILKIILHYFRILSHYYRMLQFFRILESCCNSFLKNLLKKVHFLIVPSYIAVTHRCLCIQVTIHKTGDIIFSYKDIPMAVTEIEDSEHPVKVGLSDAYIVEKTIFCQFPLLCLKLNKHQNLHTLKLPVSVKGKF